MNALGWVMAGEIAGIILATLGVIVYRRAKWGTW